jgi:hypothetical protein
MQNVYVEMLHNKTLLREIKKDLNKWTGIPSSWNGRSNNVKMSVLPILIYGASVFCLFFLIGSNKSILKDMWKCKRGI